jgi:hypothetical protein
VSELKDAELEKSLLMQTRPADAIAFTTSFGEIETESHVKAREID